MSGSGSVLAQIAQLLQQSAAAVPAPGNALLRIVSSVISLAALICERGEASLRNRSMVENVCHHSYHFGKMVTTWCEKLMDDNEFVEFLEGDLKSTMEDVGRFVSEVEQQSVTSTISNYEDYKSRYKDLCGRLKLHMILFHMYTFRYAHKSQEGPAVLIEHPEIRSFWIGRIGAVHEVPWTCFWQQFLGEYESLGSLFDDQGSSNRAKLEAKAGTTMTVGPFEMNKIFHPAGDSVENIVTRVLEERRSENLRQGQFTTDELQWADAMEEFGLDGDRTSDREDLPCSLSSLLRLEEGVDQATGLSFLKHVENSGVDDVTRLKELASTMDSSWVYGWDQAAESSDSPNVRVRRRTLIKLFLEHERLKFGIKCEHMKLLFNHALVKLHLK